MLEHGLKLTVNVPGFGHPVELHTLNFLERMYVAADFRKERMMWANWPPDFQVIKAELTDRNGKVVGDGAELLNKIISNLTLPNVKSAQRKNKS